MKFGLREVVDLKVFNESDELVTVLDTSRESFIQYIGEDEKGVGYVGVKDALIDLNFIKFISDESSELTDYEKAINSNMNTIELGGSGNRKCKLVGNSYARSRDSGGDCKYLIEAPNAEVINRLSIENNTYDPSDFDILFKVKPYNDKGSLFKIHL
ncbi:hypothetical protein JOC34_000564 [Virgibacillus halotolerans]|uniref:hypothetical protein n=1 Tax=Virgibacillus halotolerans TaxID=1071053 RepID=UPI00195FCE33|nr:hypothetical protein [Virgibacillus halotolerans]MBM7598207.1 hypothetical protein [Virgibacillus halotolerans]